MVFKMTSIENFFKHKISLTSSRQYNTFRMRRTICLTGLYKSNVIHNTERHGFKDINELVAQIKPFLYYLASKCMNREEEDDYTFSGFLKVSIFS